MEKKNTILNVQCLKIIIILMLIIPGLGGNGSSFKTMSTSSEDKELISLSVVFNVKLDLEKRCIHNNNNFNV